MNSRTDHKFQNAVQKTLAAVPKKNKCPACNGLGVTNFPAGPVPIGAKMPICTACGGTGKNRPLAR
jgi:DnaJ-class molecular chaperone